MSYEIRSIVRRLRRIARKRLGARAVRRLPLRPEFRHLAFSGHALQKLLDAYAFHTVLDIGCGAGHHADCFLRAGKQVTAIDYGQSVYFRRQAGSLRPIVADFNTHVFAEPFDCVWCSHVLEHQLNAQQFLEKVNAVLRENGVLAITVPPRKNMVVGGHVSLWNAGLLLYRLVLAGFDCRDARVLQYGYNVSVIVEKHTVNVLDAVAYDSGDVRKLRPFLPEGLPFVQTDTDDVFDGDIWELNWF